MVEPREPREPTEHDRRYAQRLVQLGMMDPESAARHLQQYTSLGGEGGFQDHLVSAGILAGEQALRIAQDLDAPPTMVLPENSLIGRTLGGYRVVEFVNAGGMGELYRAHDPVLDKDFAIKVIPAEISRDSKYSARLHQEARLASRIDDPNLVPILKFGEEDGVMYCVMPFVEGTNLGAHVRRRGSGLSVREALSIVAQAARGLAAAHRVGIVHRDVKPENLLIDPDGRVRVTDFGLARDLGSDSSLTATGQVMGTPYFMSPEQATGQAVDERTDLYSLGLTFWFLLTGRVPFEGNSALSVLDKQLRTPLPHPSAINPEARGRAVDLLLWMCAKQAADRPRSMEQVIEEIEAILADDPGPAPRRPRSSPIGSRALIAAGGAVAFLGSFLLGNALLGGKESLPDPTPTDGPNESPGPDPREAEAAVRLETVRTRLARDPVDPKAGPDLDGIVARYPDTAAAKEAGRLRTEIDRRLASRHAELEARIEADQAEAIRGLRAGDVLAALESARDPGDPDWTERLNALRVRLIDQLVRAFLSEVERRRRRLGDDDLSGLRDTVEWVDATRDTTAQELGPAAAALVAAMDELRREAQDRFDEALRREIAAIDERLDQATLEELAEAVERIRSIGPDGVHRPRIAAIRDRLLELRLEAVASAYEPLRAGDPEEASRRLQGAFLGLPEEASREGTAAFEAFANSLWAARREMWTTLWEEAGTDLAGAREALESLELPRMSLDSRNREPEIAPEYPVGEELRPIEIRIESESVVQAFFQTNVKAGATALHFRGHAEAQRSKKLLRQTKVPETDRLILERKDENAKWVPFDPLRDLSRVEWVWIFAGESLATDGIPAPGTIEASKRPEAVVLALLARDPDLAESLLERSGTDPLVVHWVRLVRASLDDSGMWRDPPFERQESAPKNPFAAAFGSIVEVEDLSTSQARVRLSCRFDDPDNASRLFDLTPAAKDRLELTGRGMVLRNPEREEEGFLAIKGNWDGDFELVVEGTIVEDEPKAGVFGISYYRRGKRDVGDRYEAGFQKTGPRQYGAMLYRVEDTTWNEQLEAAPPLSVGPHREFVLRLDCSGGVHRVQVTDSNGKGEPVVFAAAASTELDGRIGLVWGGLDVRVEAITLRGQVAIRSLFRPR